MVTSQKRSCLRNGPTDFDEEWTTPIAKKKRPKTTPQQFTMSSSTSDQVGFVGIPINDMKDTPPESGSFTSAPRPFFTEPCQPINAPRAPGSTFLLTRENFANIFMKAKRVNEQVTSLLNGLSVFVNRVIKKAMKSMREVLTTSQQLVTSRMDRLEARVPFEMDF
ncbi:hypothetical protein HAX54_037259 [Datura stramonium]|uniref:Uncharacterized protein n=1 Tax=Datura stramonium TaxID=4076 RepID=A0ABS8VJC8_DATST|nr:hypothetical protein [Datura stramonium]